MKPLVSLIIATYNSGSDLDKLVASLDAQTLPQDQFEAVFVDDGSTDDTFTRLKAFAQTRANYQIKRIENSGWPSKPRNIGMKMARGDYVCFMDHDDAIFPDGLRRLTQYAQETSADIVIPHEEKSNNVWMFASSIDCGNASDIETVGGFSRMIPMVPHKLYRRDLLLDNGVFFPERRRALWEDQYINVGAYRHASTVSVNADTPFYLWRATRDNTSFTFDPSREDYWTNLEHLLEFTSASLIAPEHSRARTTALALHTRARLTDRLMSLLMRDDRTGKEFAMAESRRLLKEYIPAEVVETLPRRHRILATLLEGGRFEQMVEFQRFDLSHRARRAVSELSVDEKSLHAVLTVDWEMVDRGVDVIVPDPSGYRWNLPDSISRCVPRELTIVEFADCNSNVEVAVRNRQDYVTWFPSRQVDLVTAERNDEGATFARQVARFEFDPSSSAFGARIGPGVWDFHSRASMLGMVRTGLVPFRAKTVPVMWSDQCGVAYSSKKGALTFDNSGRYRSFAIDSIGNAPIVTVPQRVDVPLSVANAYGDGEADARLFVVPPSKRHWWPRASAKPTEPVHLDLQIVNMNGDCRLRGRFDLPPGEYRLIADRDGRFEETAKTLVVETSHRAEIR